MHQELFVYQLSYILYHSKKKNKKKTNNSNNFAREPLNQDIDWPRKYLFYSWAENHLNEGLKLI